MGRPSYKTVNFDNDQMCIRCGRFYIPSVLNDNGKCELCNRKRQYIKDPDQITLKILLNAWQTIRECYPCENDVTSIVYFFRGRETQRVKIGFTSNSVWDRLASCQTGSPDPLEMMGIVEAPLAVERELHKMLEQYHSHNEWFNGTSALFQFIHQISHMPKPPL